MEQVQSAQAQLAHESAQLPHWQAAWLHVAQVQSAHVQFAQESVQLVQAHVEHSS
ncbi:hypothetical protein [Kutzneria chonburiensis]|uniref:Uncharacterized protein n=1 Tax=Kutzneria chonburiensis TaxID=1483604 RepID=A0ABV6N1L4_9PSEU|nr:hypothetical protein [Kutzneria chonburiensis]